MTVQAWYMRHFSGTGGIASLLIMAFPMMISYASDTLMMFCDRYFLSQVGKEYISAAMVGGLSSFFAMTLWFGVNGYVNALVAQYYGARQKGCCSVAVTQGFILSILAYPFILICIPLVNFLFVWSNPDPLQLILQKKYFLVLTLASPLSLFRLVLGSFFTGIGRVNVVMFANIVGVIVNVPLSYILIFGKWGFPELDIFGAAYGTVISEGVILAILAIVYYKLRNPFQVFESFYFNRRIFFNLVRYGFPAGLELFFSMAAINIVTLQFHSYGLDVATAVTIVLNWDLVSFLPMIGLNIATTSLVGQNIGAKNFFEAERTLFSSLKVALVYSLFMTGLFLFMTTFLVNVFVPETLIEQYSQVIEMGKVMLRLAAFYVTAEALMLSVLGALHGAGDTLWPMCAKIIISVTFASLITVLIRVYAWSPTITWSIFACNPIALFFAMCLRYRTEKWKTMSLLT